MQYDIWNPSIFYIYGLIFIFSIRLPYAKVMIEYFKKFGYIPEKSFRAAAYDWRFGPTEWRKPGNYFDKLKKLVEETYYLNDQKKVHLIGHSLGGPVIQSFLAFHVNDSWKEKYIASMISLGGAYDGAFKMLHILSQGMKLPISFETNIRFFRSIQSGAWMVPTIYNPNLPIIITPKKNYTINNLNEYFKDLNATEYYNMVIEQNEAAYKWKDPNVTVHCIYGTTYRTPYAVFIEDITKKSSSKQLISNEGDGTVQLHSLQVCSKFSKSKTYNGGNVDSKSIK